MSWVLNLSHMVTLDHGHDLTDGTQMDVSHENPLAGMPISATLLATTEQP